MASIDHQGFVALDLEFLESLRALKGLSDEQMSEQFRIHQLIAASKQASIETLLHAFLPSRFIIHTHPDAILALTNRAGWEQTVGSCFGETVAQIPYARVGFDLASVVAALRLDSSHQGVIIAQHGLVTWGETARQAFERTIALVSAAESFLEKRRVKTISVGTVLDENLAQQRYTELAPLVRGLLCAPGTDPDNPYNHVILDVLNGKEVLDLLSWPQARELLCSPPLTPDYLVRTRVTPLWLDNPRLDSSQELRNQLAAAIDEYVQGYRSHAGPQAQKVALEQLYPRVVLIPGIGAICAGRTHAESRMVSDITMQVLKVKKTIYETEGEYVSLDRDHLLDMEFRSYQQAKVSITKAPSLQGKVAVVTGSAGAIGLGIAEMLLANGCNVALTDLPGPQLDRASTELAVIYGERVFAVPLDVTSEESVAGGFGCIARRWGGIDIVVVNAGIAHVSPLTEMDIARFRKLEQVNVEGTLLSIRQASRMLTMQHTGGDIILVSTKNVFAPGAKFGAYSATKAASHQLARIASLELADQGIRVNMVAPDAVFSHGEKRSGLWAEVGPDRMKARNLDEAGLEEYYRSRNLLKARITAEHVARAVMFFVTHQTPTTGATIPVDGGLPDATPR